MAPKPGRDRSATLNRRAILKAGMAASTVAVASPWVLRRAHAQTMDLGPYQEAKINWRQAEGQRVNVAVIAASYFQNLIDITPEFEALTGIKVGYEKVPPGQLRQKCVLDLSSKTGTYSTHAGDPMYLSLYAANNWTEALENYLSNPALTDNNWFQVDDIIEAWRKADMVNGKTYALPFQGEMTIQIYRKDLFDAKGLKPAETFDDILNNAKAIHDPQIDFGASACAEWPVPDRTCTSTRRSQVPSVPNGLMPTARYV